MSDEKANEIIDLLESIKWVSYIGVIILGFIAGVLLAFKDCLMQ